MEISDVRRRVTETVERARHSAAARRTRSDQGARDYSTFLETLAVPLFRQVASALKAQGFPFVVFTPSGSVRLASEKAGEDYIELYLDTAGNEPAVVGRSRRSRGRRIIENEGPIAAGPIAELTEAQVLDYVLRELEPLVEK
jgi:hypothetical protein